MVIVPCAPGTRLARAQARAIRNTCVLDFIDPAGGDTLVIGTLK